jgi:PhnB protein
LHLRRQRTHRIPHQQFIKEKATMTVKPIPEGYHTVTPYLIAEGADKLIDFLKTAFEAKEILCMTRPDGVIGHAEVRSAILL